VLQLIFLLIAAVGLLAALGTVLARNLVHAALYLVAFFFAIACQFILLEAEFLAAIQVLVYIGAVAILLMFGIMLTRNIQGDDTTTLAGGWKIPGLLAGLCVFGVLFYGINHETSPVSRTSWSLSTERPSIGLDAGQERAVVIRREAVNDMAKVIGNELMTRYVVAFEMAGLLLTAALVGAIALAHREENEPEATSSAEQSVRRATPLVSPPAMAKTPGLTASGTAHRT
jgi:NADH:ubiquinone oxidoreductase subunit 6 (subunit J)